MNSAGQTVIDRPSTHPQYVRVFRWIDPALARALSYFRNDIRTIVLSLFVIALGKGCELLQVYPFAILADQTFGNLTPTDRVTRAMLALAPTRRVGQIVALAAMVLVLRLLQELLGTLQTLLNVRIGYRASLRIRSELYRHVQRLGLDFHRRNPQGDTLYRLAWDTAGVQGVLNAVLQGVVVSSITLAIMIVILLAKNVPLTLVSLAVVPPLLWTTHVYGRILSRRTNIAKQHEAELTTTLQRSVSAIGLTQAFGREEAEFQRFDAVARQSAKSWVQLHRQEVLLWLWIGAIFGVGAAGIFGLGGYLVYRDQFQHRLGEQGMTLGKLWIFIAYLSMLYVPLKTLSGSGAALATGLASARRVFELLDETPTVQDIPGVSPLPLQRRTLTLDDVSFAYESDCTVLSNIRCVIPAGEAVAFVGPSGAGKSTLLTLLNRMHDPTRGAVCLDGIDLRTIRLADVRAHVATVTQNTVILPGSLRENIAYGRPSATDAEIHHAIELAGATQFVGALPGGLDHVLAEGGANLSGGQRQRIAIARAILGEAPILVMDEPTSALDTASEMKLVETLARLRGKRTIILVSHHPSTVAGCDRVFELSGGRLKL